MKSNLVKAMKQVALGGVLASVASGAFAADGSLGATSTGSIDISLTVADEIRIFGLDDMPLVFAGTDIQGVSNACVYRNAGAPYNVTVTGDGDASGTGGTDFFIENGAGDAIPYSVSWNDDPAGTGTPVTLTSGVGPVGFTNAQSGSPTSCGGTDNVQILVDMLAADVTAEPAGTYSGTMTILVAPI